MKVLWLKMEITTYNDLRYFSRGKQVFEKHVWTDKIILIFCNNDFCNCLSFANSQLIINNLSCQYVFALNWWANKVTILLMMIPTWKTYYFLLYAYFYNHHDMFHKLVHPSGKHSQQNRILNLDLKMILITVSSPVDFFFTICETSLRLKMDINQVLLPPYNGIWSLILWKKTGQSFLYL